MAFHGVRAASEALSQKPLSTDSGLSRSQGSATPAPANPIARSASCPAVLAIPRKPFGPDASPLLSGA
jgi:hypothetical protein